MYKLWKSYRVIPKGSFASIHRFYGYVLHKYINSIVEKDIVRSIIAIDFYSIEE